MGWKTRVQRMKPGTPVDVEWYDITEWVVASDPLGVKEPDFSVHTYRLANPKWGKTKDNRLRFLRLTTGKQTSQPGLCVIPEGCIVDVRRAK